jgi:methyl-accepting chemotaxis protein
MSFMFRDMAKGQGDLTKRLAVYSMNEVGQLAFWFNIFMKDIEDIVGHVRKTALELHHTAEDVNKGSRGLSHETQQQASTVEQISASINDMNATIHRNTELVIEGKDTSHTVTALIDQNRQVFSKLMGAIREISLDSQKIGDIVSTVNEVAFHTNLLALNAAVEAARAGEHGKGFAVVAGEVRSLAQRSSEAAREIKSLIEGTVSRILNGDEMMRKTSQSLEELMGRMETFFRMMEVIGSSSSDQARSISELSSSVTVIDGSAQHSAATAQSLADSMEGLRDMAVTLTEDVKKFKTSVSA